MKSFWKNVIIMDGTSPDIFVVLGNEKGGVGKSTLAANLVIGIGGTGLSVGLMDLHVCQRAIARDVGL